MSTFGSPAKSYSDIRNLNLKGGTLGTGLIRWKAPTAGATTLWASNPYSSTEIGLYLNASGNLAYSYLGAVTVLGAAGGGGAVPSWDQVFANDKTLTVTGTTFTVDDAGTGANDVFTASSSAAGSGNIIQITNGGSGNDINGTNGTWFVTALGAATLLSIDSATITNTTGNIILKATGAGSVTIGANTNTITLAKAATFSSTITVTDGLSTFISTSNIAQNALLTNNTITTYGAAASSAGMLVVRSTSLTTGTAIRAQLAETPLTTGKYFEAWDSENAGTSVWSVGAGGVQTFAGVAGSTIFTLTAGDFLMSDGSITVVDADNAASLSVTNNTATSESPFVFVGSGVFTGTTTKSFMTLTPSGLTTGTALYLAAVGATTSVGVVDIITAGLTSGSALRITSSTAAFTTGGKLIELTSVAAVAGNLLTATTTGAYTGTGMILVTAGAATTGILVSLVSTTGLTSGSLLRATTSTAGAIATNGAISFSATGAFTSTARVGFLNVAANTTTGGVVAHISGTAITDGHVLILEAVEATLTTGKYFACFDGAANDFSIGQYGATVIAGNAATTVFTITAGHAVITAGNLTLTLGDLVLTTGNLTVVGGITSSSPTGNGIGYSTGAGGTVTQITNRSTGVTLNTLCGKIQTDTTSLAAGASAEFTFTNSTIAIGDVVVISQRSGSSSLAGVAGTLIVEVVTVAAGSCIISLNNNSSTTAETGAVVLNFAVIKAVTA